MLDHFLALGGNEIVNSWRAYRYAQTAECRVTWLKDPKCATIAEAEGDSPYAIEAISDAPWYDPDDPDLTSRFLGLYGIEFSGLSDSTRSATVQQKTTDGAVTTGYRHNSREVRVRAWMTAIGEDAMEAGMTWLRNVLEPNACGQHGASCGEADSRFFVDCPPTRRETEQYTEWAPEATNLVTNPRVEVNATGYASTGTWASAPTRRIPFPVIPHPDPDHLEWCYGGTDTGASETNQNIRYDLGSLPIGQYRVGFWAKVAGTGAATARLANNTALNPSFEASNLTLNDQWAWKAFSFTVGATSNVYLGIYGQGASNFDAEMSGLILVAGAGDPLTPEDYFDGATPADDDLEQYVWTGTADASTSQRQLRSSFIGPEPDDSYAGYVNGWRRFLHSVRCISGPFPVQERQTADGRVKGRLVEFTLMAEVPWVYGAPKEIEIPPMVPTVMQDIAFNLAPYPSAELAGSAVAVATNHCINPSLRNNADNWTTALGGAITGTLNSGRVTGELYAAVGDDASFRTVFTATNSGTNAYFANLPPVANIPTAPGTRVSISLWAAAVVMSGSPVVAPLEFYAFWRSGSTILGHTALGTVPVGGGAVTQKSLVPLPGADKVQLEARVQLTSWSSGDVIRLYTDAVAVTTP